MIFGGIKHRPFGAWAEEEDKLESEAEENRQKEKLNPSQSTQYDVRGKTWTTK